MKRALQLWDAAYRASAPLTLRTDAQRAHAQFIRALRWADAQTWLLAAVRGWGNVAQPLTVGGVRLPSPLILAAGLVKGDGFADEASALAAVHAGKNIIAGWRALPALLGAVEFGSFTRYPRLGNSGTVLWRMPETRSTQNRIGLKNPGALAAAEFLAARAEQLPPVYGINIAVSPGVSDPHQEAQEALEALEAFQSRGLRPSWYTLNLSCPNTEDDPLGNQTETKAAHLCGVMAQAAADVPLWVKVSPCLSAAQYSALMAAFARVGVRAVIATNTLGMPTPQGDTIGGVAGGILHDAALSATAHLHAAQVAQSAPVEIVGCGGVLDGASYTAFRQRGASAVQYYSALIYRSPLAAAIIAQEAATQSTPRGGIF